MKKGVNKVLFLCLGLIFLVGVVSAWSVSITKLNNAAPQNYYDTNITSFSYNLGNITCGYAKYSLNGGPLNPIGCANNTEISFPISPIQGNNTLIVYGNNTNGTLKNDTVNFWIDSIPPVLDYVTPSSNLAYTNLNTLYFQFWLNETNKKSYHPNNFAPFSLKIKDPWNVSFGPPSLLMNLSSTDATLSENWSQSIPSAFLGEGNYTYIVKAQDKYPDNTTIREVNITGVIIRDITSPNVSIDNPQNGNNKSKIISINISASDIINTSLTGSNDISGLDYLTMNITQGATLIYNETTNSSPLTYNWNSSAVADGDYNITAISYDKAGNPSGTTLITINVDNTAPSVIINYPINGTYYNTNSTLFNVTATDPRGIDSCWYTIDGGLTNQTLTNSGNDYTYTQIVSPDGIYTAQFYCNDSVGNLNNSESVVFIIDTTAPVITYTNNTENNNTYFNRDWIFVEVNVTETNEDTITFNLYNSSTGGLIYSNSSLYISGINSINWSGLAEGVYYYNVTANDSAGNNASTLTRTISLDRTDPLISFVPSTSSGNYSQSYIEANITFSDFFTLDYATIYLYDSTGLINSSNNSVSPFFINFTNLLDGIYYLNASVVDKAGNKANTTTNVIILDTTAPNLTSSSITGGYLNTIFSPANQDGFYDNETITMNASEMADWGTTYIYNSSSDKVYRKTAPGINYQISRSFNWDGQCSVVYCTGYVPDGNYSVYTNLTDMVGNSGIVYVGNITVDNTSPTITLNSSNPLILEASVYNYTEYGANYSDLHGIYNSSEFIDNSSVNTSVIGNYNVTYYIEDNLRNNATAIRTVIVKDTIVPVLNISENATSLELGVDSIEINWSVTDFYSDTVMFNITNSSNAVVYSSGSVSGNIILLPTNLTQIGTYTISLWANDTSGNNDSTTLTFNVSDGVNPLIEFVNFTTAPGYYQQNYINATINATDTNFQSATIYLYNSTGGIIPTTTNISGIYSFNFAGLSEGTYYLNASVTDIGGNPNQTETRTIILDSTPPVLTGGPNETQISSSSEEIFWTTNESVTAIVYYWITNTTSVQNTSNSSYSNIPVVTLTGLSASTNYSYNITYCDQAGNCAPVSGPYNFTTMASSSSTTTSSGGGGGGGSGGNGQGCVPSSWSCEWDSVGCQGGTIDRICVSDCDTTEITQVDCQSPDKNDGGAPNATDTTNPGTTDSGRGAGITGAVVGFAKTGAGKLTLGVIGFLALSWFFLAWRRKKKEKEEGKK